MTHKQARQVLAQSPAPKITVTRACLFSGHSRQAWYQDNARRRKMQKHYAQVLDFVACIRCRQPRIGARTLHYQLNTQADKRLNIGRDSLFNLLDEYRLLVPVNRAYHKTTNIIKNDFWCRPPFLLSAPPRHYERYLQRMKEKKKKWRIQRHRRYWMS